MKALALLRAFGLIVLISTLIFIACFWSKGKRVGKRASTLESEKSLTSDQDVVTPLSSVGSTKKDQKAAAVVFDKKRFFQLDVRKDDHKKIDLGQKIDPQAKNLEQVPKKKIDNSNIKKVQETPSFHDKKAKLQRLLPQLISKENSQHFPPQLVEKRQKLQEPLHHLPQPIDHHQMNSRVSTVYTLPPEVISSVKKFVFFVGYARSGHSIIGTLMDAHPHVIIANEFNLFAEFSELNRAPKSTWRDNLYSLLYSRSIKDTKHSRATQEKGYKLKVNGLWQGKYYKYIEVIGDKSGDITTKAYADDPTGFLRNLEKLKREVSVPLCIIHTIRNPFDIISTSVVIMNENTHEFREMKKSNSDADLTNDDHKFENRAVVSGNIPVFFRRINTVMELIEIFGRENVLDVHNRDLVADPKGTISRIFKFLKVSTPPHYLDLCAAKVFKNVSRSRNIVKWTPEQIEMVEERMKDYEVLNRYSFTSD